MTAAAYLFLLDKLAGQICARCAVKASVLSLSASTYLVRSEVGGKSRSIEINGRKSDGFLVYSAGLARKKEENNPRKEGFIHHSFIIDEYYDGYVTLPLIHIVHVSPSPVVVVTYLGVLVVYRIITRRVG